MIGFVYYQELLNILRTTPPKKEPEQLPLFMTQTELAKSIRPGYTDPVQEDK
jgi:hypothetical protein